MKNNFDCPFNDGDEISCRIHDEFIVKGVIVFDNDHLFIVHDNKRSDGSGPNNLRGYKYGWTVCTSNNNANTWEKGTGINSVSEVKLLKKNKLIPLDKPEGVDVYVLTVRKNIPKNISGFKNPAIPKGYKTWVISSDPLEAMSLHPEDNRWSTNFPASYFSVHTQFKVITDNEYFKSGDKVKITNDGSSYTTHSDAFEALGFKNKKRNSASCDGDEGNVFVVAQIEGYPNSTVYIGIDLDNGKQCLMCSKGIEVIESKYSFNRGDLVVMTNYKGDADYKEQWIQNGEIIELGGEYWENHNLKKYNDGSQLDAISKKSPLGNGFASNSTPDSYIIRHITSAERKHFNKVGRGANVKDMVIKKIRKVAKKAYTYNKGDLVVLTKFCGDTEWSGHWIKSGEIIELGGKYWDDDNLSAYNAFKQLDAIAGSNPEGNGMGGGNFEIRPASSMEIEHFHKVGRGATIYDDSRFIKNDYIVVLDTVSNGTFKVGYCFKQREDNDYIRPYLDAIGQDNNGTTYISFHKTDRWRKATRAEIKRYNALGKPYDTSISEKKYKLDENIKKKETITSLRKIGTHKDTSFFNKTVKILIKSSSSLSKQVQMKLFELGYSWASRDQSLLESSMYGIWAAPDGNLSYSVMPSTYENSESIAVTVEDVLSFKINKEGSLLPEPRVKHVVKTKRKFAITKRKKSLSF